MARYHVVDTWHGGVIVAELDKARKYSRSWRRPPKKVRDQIRLNAVIAAGVVLGCWLSFALVPA